jgi:hypothetical protein
VIELAKSVPKLHEQIKRLKFEAQTLALNFTEANEDRIVFEQCKQDIKALSENLA